MFTASVKTEIPVPWPESLKDKRALVRSLRDRLRKRFNLSVAEVERLDDRRTIVLGLACVGAEPGPLQRTLDEALRFVQGSVEGDVLCLEREIL